ncbi:flagellar biosynthetic protein FliO [Neobacillus cucumis]|uniref:Flagellar biosynthesis protein FliZ n=1 Tax=Neobacillus cucumis TaxID=1740721 RepID=A0A2N5H7H5_9BACI|nr:flagellar biosynthetic protein FliO [Neobacillus cucumis]PLS01465.1 hypothetical protein CVD27_25200 [Neobacillus cucumis]
MKQLRKKTAVTLLFVFLFNFFVFHQPAWAKAETTVYDAFQQDKGAANKNTDQGTISNEETRSIVPSFIKFIFSFAVIIILLLLCLKFLKANQKQIHSQGPFYAMGGHALGGNRSLQLVMIGQTLYILGIGNEVQLLRMIEPGEEQDSILQSLADDTERKQKPKLFSYKKKQTESWDQTFLSQLNHLQQSSIPINKLKD